MCASSRTGSPHPDDQTEQLSEQVPCLLPSSDDTYTSNTSDFIHEDQVLQSVEPSYQVSVDQLLEERLQTLDARHGIESGTWDWHVVSREEKVLRTDKPVRMRVRWDCHRCKIPMDRDKRCTECQHSRCPMCPRNPPVRHDKEPRADLESRDDMGNSQAPIMAEIDWNDMGVLLNRPGLPGGQELVHKPPRQRVRRMCHLCDYTFMPGNKTCESCGHVRCSDCPRDP
ncbi:hypothetical protein VHEMI00591 [[Torrubiella] hemipterigena]|nr:hypothetical protein VHEMI00591 [[Torrubiella] hemipterigena]